MNKNFLITCIVISNILVSTSWGSVRLITDPPEPHEQQDFRSQQIVDTSSLPDPNNEKEVRDYFKKRLETVAVSVVPSDLDMNEPSSFDIIHTPEYYAAQEEKNKPLFQKMYEEALKSLHDKEASPYKSPTDRIDSEEQAAQAATRFFTLAQTQNKLLEDESVPTVSFLLPSGRRALAPAVEHIPYILSYIDIQANGYMKIEETIIIVANNNKFIQPLKRIFPKYVYDKGKRRNIEFIMGSVTINGTPIPYAVEEIGDNIIVKSKYKQKLEPGVYTYKYNYLVNRYLQRNNNSILMNWNIFGRPINAFITSANAIVTVPSGHGFQVAKTIIGREQVYYDRRTNIYPLAKNVVAFSNNTPIMNGENMNILVVLDKNVLLDNFDKSYNNFLFDWGNIIYASLGLIAILISFLLSLYEVKKNRRIVKYKPSYSGSTIRSLLVGKFDRVAFITQLLDLYRKNALDFITKENRIFIQRKEISPAKLNKSDKKVMKILFNKKLSTLEINNKNSALIKKARDTFKKYQEKSINKQRQTKNLRYIIFNFAILIITEIFIAMNSINFAQNILIITVSTCLYIFYLWIIFHRFKTWYLSLPIKVLSLFAIFITWIFSSVYIGGTVEFLIIIMVCVIFTFAKLFNEHSSFINEAKSAISAYKEYLITNADAINLSRDFINQQANIFALSISEYFPQNVSNQNYYRLNVAELLKDKLIGII